MTQPPESTEPPDPPGESAGQAPPPAAPAPLGGGAPPVSGSAERVRLAYRRRHETDYIFDFWTALGWTILTCGIYGLYIVYQLARRSRDHGLRRLEELEAANAFAWEQTETRGRQDELREHFERVATHLATLRQMTTEFRDPVVWTLLAVVASGIAQIVLYVLLDGDLVKRDHAEGGAEFELAQIYAALGSPVSVPDSEHLHTAHNYVGRIIATVVTCGIYTLWWQYDIMTETNRHFERDWAWEDSLAHAVVSLASAPA